MPSESLHRWRIVPIQKQYQRDDFDCGYPSLNDYIKKYARQNDQKVIAKAFVALADESNKIVGYYTLSSQEVGVYAVRVDALDAKAKEFYLRHEFLPFQDVELSLFLPIATIAKGFKELE